LKQKKKSEKLSLDKFDLQKSKRDLSAANVVLFSYSDKNTQLIQ